MAVRINSADSTERYVGTEQAPRQVLRLEARRTVTDGVVTVSLLGDGVRGTVSLPPGEGEITAEVPFDVDPGTPPGHRLNAVLRLQAEAATSTDERAVTITVAEPGWTMYLVPYLRPEWENNAFHLVKAHLDLAVSDPDYTFVVAEIDHLKPFWDVYPEYRAVLRNLIAARRVEVVGGTYNEPNANLTGLETTIRNLVYGIGYQRDIIGADPRTAWQSDVFGHTPQFPGLAADAGLTSSVWARGAHHMQFPAEFELLSPSGKGVLTHYSTGWWMDSSQTLEEAEEGAYGLFLSLKQTAATRNTLLPIGADHNRWVTAIHRDWNACYVWPRFITGLPRDFFAAVRAELEERGAKPSPQTHDMNPVCTGKDVSYLDTKQAQRATETAATDAERLATFASLLGYGRYPSAALDKVWRLLAHGARGSKSDQAYIDLIAGLREAHDLAVQARDAALKAICSHLDSVGEGLALTVFNTLAFTRTDLVRASFELPSADIVGATLIDDEGIAVPFVVEACDGKRLVISFVAARVPSCGWRTLRLVPDASAPFAELDWQAGDGASIANEFYQVSADVTRGGGLDSVVELAAGRELIQPREVGNELRLHGQVLSSASQPADSLHIERSAAGERIVAVGSVGDVQYEQRTTLWYGLNRVDLRTRILDFAGSDQTLQVKFPADIPGARPVSEVAGAVIGRGFALPESDTPANTFFALGSTATLDLGPAKVAISIAEVVVPEHHYDEARELVIALARVGVTAITMSVDGNRYNLADVRIVLGSPETNPMAAEILERCDSLTRDEFARLLKEHGSARLFIPPEVPARALPVLLIAGVCRDEQAAAISTFAAELAATHSATVTALDLGSTVPLDDHTIGIVSNGLPGFAIDPSGALHLSLMRSFQRQHWTHDFGYALISGSGDWRSVDLVSAGAEFSQPLLARQVVSHAGSLPPHHSLLSLKPEHAVQVTAVKPSGNPESVGSGLEASPELGFTVRLVEATGTGTKVAVKSPLGILSGDRADLLEECGLRCEIRASGAVQLAGSDIATAIMIPHQGSGSPESAPFLGRSTEPAQPIYSRYWLHNRGPAPMGFLPVSCTVTPTVLYGAGTASVTVASQYTDMSFEGLLSVITPDGWTAEPEARPIKLEPGGHTVFPLEITPAPNTAAGMYFVRVQLRAGESVVEDVISVLMDCVATGLEVTSITPEIVAIPGERTHLSVAFANRTRGRIDGEAMPVSPWGTWSLVGPYAVGFSVEPGAESTIEFDVEVPIDAEPGHWWTMVKLMWFGRVQYSPTIPIIVR